MKEDKKVKVDLHPMEWELIDFIREKMPYGAFAIVKTQNGLPMSIETHFKTGMTITVNKI